MKWPYRRGALLFLETIQIIYIFMINILYTAFMDAQNKCFSLGQFFLHKHYFECIHFKSHVKGWLVTTLIDLNHYNE